MTEATQIDLGPILADIRRRFYGRLPEKRFFQDRAMLEYAITWPAAWLRGRGVTWSANRYFATISGKLDAIQKHGTQAATAYFPGYLLKVLQDHFAHNSDAICEEGKAARNAFGLALGKITAATAAQGSSVRAEEAVIDVLAAAHSLLAKPRARKKAAPRHDSTPELPFG